MNHFLKCKVVLQNSLFHVPVKFVASSKRGNNQACKINFSSEYLYFSNCLLLYVLSLFCAYISLSCCKHCPTVGYTKLNHLMDLWFSWLRSLGLSALLAAILFGLLLSFTVISTWLALATGHITGCAQNMIWKRGPWFWYWWVVLCLLKLSEETLVNAVSSGSLGNRWRKRWWTERPSVYIYW